MKEPAWYWPPGMIGIQRPIHLHSSHSGDDINHGLPSLSFLALPTSDSPVHGVILSLGSLNSVIRFLFINHPACPGASGLPVSYSPKSVIDQALYFFLVKMRVLTAPPALAVWCLVGCVMAHPGTRNELVPVRRFSVAQASQRVESVKQAFQVAWDGYKQYAFRHDQLHPLSNSYDDNLYGLPGDWLGFRDGPYAS
jgi:Glycosyl hydrolase family 47